jgi:protein tyrosine phosphatase (PTP) superfamily phosphohydrolase (DUF442 family)
MKYFFILSLWVLIFSNSILVSGWVGRGAWAADPVTLRVLALECIERNTHGCPLKHFFKVSDGVFRGQRPSTELDFDLLQSLGIKVIINVEDYFSTTKRLVQEEVRLARERGIQVIHQPLSPVFLNRKDDIRRILTVMAESERRPVYLHCKFGRERTGLLVALHQIFNQHIPVEEAKKSMIQYGFRSLLVPAMYFQLRYWLSHFVALGEIPPSSQKEAPSLE